jgi:hypothetical protein
MAENPSCGDFPDPGIVLEIGVRQVRGQRAIEVEFATLRKTEHGVCKNGFAEGCGLKHRLDSDRGGVSCVGDPEGLHPRETPVAQHANRKTGHAAFRHEVPNEALEVDEPAISGVGFRLGRGGGRRRRLRDR